MKVDIFDFDLPNSLIAKKSASPKDLANMLIINRKRLENSKVLDLPDLFQKGDVFVVNNTKVIPSRVKFRSDQFKNIEATFLNEIEQGIWRALAKPSKKLNIGDNILLLNKYKIRVIDKKQGGEVLFDVNMDVKSFINLLEYIGEMPLPPYLKNNSMMNPYKDYQTIFASKTGAVASPTAGLHFTNNLIKKLKNKNIHIVPITLHVGSGTFLPIKVDDIDKHIMHKEYFEISKNTANKINEAKKNGGKIISVGTTVLRALESSINKEGRIISNNGYTDIFITPNKKVTTTDYLFTNFHLPKSSLFVLVCSYAGIKVMQNAYTYAKENNYRFYSLGDACLIKKETKSR